MSPPFDVPGIPPLDWLTEPGSADLDGDTLMMTAGPMTDWFNDPGGSTRVASAPALVCRTEGDFQLAATITVGFGATFDAGVLFVHQTGDDWAKFCFEQDPTGQPMVVSVVTRGVSDDSNEPAIDGDTVHLRVSRTGDAFAFHYSTATSIAAADAASGWKMSRLFALRQPSRPVTIGFMAQSPTGQGCTARFSDVSLTATTLADPRNGT